MEGLMTYIFSVDFLNSVLRMGTPLLFVGMAAIIGAKANVLCIAFEGMMLFAAMGGVLGSAWTQNLLLGASFGILCGMAIAALFAYFVLKLDTAPMMIGLGLNILGSAGTVFALWIFAGSKSSSTALPSLVFPNVDIPIIKDIPVLGDVISGQNVLTYLSLITVAIVYIFIYKTPLGLRIRAVGEDPAAAESVGVNVVRTKFIALMISGVLASLGGIFMSMGYMPYFNRDMVAGRGFIGIAAQNLGAGHPLATMLWTFVFGGATALGNIAQSYRLPSQFASMLPYAMTLLGLVLMNINVKKSPRKAESKKKEEKHA